MVTFFKKRKETRGGEQRASEISLNYQKKGKSPTDGRDTCRVASSDCKARLRLTSFRGPAPKEGRGPEKCYMDSKLWSGSELPTFGRRSEQRDAEESDFGLSQRVRARPTVWQTLAPLAQHGEKGREGRSGPEAGVSKSRGARRWFEKEWRIDRWHMGT